MQQRKLNTRFLVILTVVVSGSVLTLVLGGRYLFQGSAQKHMQMAELYARQNRHIEAAEEYKLAITRDHGNAELYVKLGDIYKQLAQSDPTYLTKDVDQWGMALQVDSAYLPAMQRLLEAYLQQSLQFNDPALFTKIKDVSSRILAIEPNDVHAKANLHMAWLQGWLAGVETSAQQIDESMKEIEALQNKDASDVDLAYVLAQAKLLRASEYTAQQRRELATLAMDEAEQVMQKAIEASPTNPRVFLRQQQILTELAGRAKSEVAKRKSYANLSAAAITRAQELAKPDDPAYVQVNLAAARMAQIDTKMDKAEAIYKDVLSHHPDERLTRVEAARFYATMPERRQDSINLLEQNISDERSQVANRGRYRKEMLLTYMLLAQTRIDMLTAATSDEEKSELKAQITGNLKEVNNRAGESVEYLKLKGRFYHVQNQFVEAIQTYRRAAEIQTQLSTHRDDDLMYQLAQVYYQVQQTGEARAILEDIVKRFEDVIPARVLLARIYLIEGNLEAAQPHLKHLEQNAPKDPRAVQLLMMASGSGKNDTRTLDLLSRMPEQGRDEKIAKARAANQAHQPAEAQRLALSVLKGNPGDEDAAVVMAQAWLQLRNAGEAKRVIDTALAANPASGNLKVLRAQLEGAQQQVIEAISENVEEIKDPFVREMARGRLADAQGKDESALAHYKKAEELKPDSADVWDILFQFHAKRRQWTELQPYLDKLVKANHDQAGGLLYRFRLAMAKSDAEQAVVMGRELVAKLPEFAQSWLSLGQALAAARRYDDAKEAYLRVLEKQTVNLDAYRGLIECCYATRKFDDAGRYVDDAYRRMPSNPTVLQMRVIHELTYGQPEKVLDELERRFAAQTTRPQVWSELGRAYERIAQRKMSRGDRDAGKWLQKTQEHWSGAVAKWPQTPEFAAHLADAYLLLGQREAAEQTLKKLLAQAPDRPESASLLSDYYARIGQAPQAESVLREAMKQLADKPELWQRLAALQVANGHADDAIKTLSDAPQSDDVLAQRMEVLIQASKFAEAKTMIQERIKAKGEDYNLVNALAFIALQENQLPTVKQLIEKSLGMQADNPIALQYRALTKLRDTPRDVDGAIVDMKLAIQQAPQSIDLRLTAADTYMAQRDTDAAVRELEAAARMSPRAKPVWTRLMELYLLSNPPRLDEAKSLVDQTRAAGMGSDIDLTIYAAKVAQVKGDTESAVTEWRRAMELANRRPEIVKSYLFALAELGRNEEAMTEARNVLSGAPDTWWAMHILAIGKARTGARDEAMSQWDKALGIADKNHDQGVSLIIMQAVARELGATQALPLVLERAKQDPRWMTFAATLYRLDGDYKNAMVMIEQALAGAGKMEEADQMRACQEAGVIYLSSQPPVIDRAISTYETVLKKHPDDIATLNNLACLYIDNMTPPDPNKALVYSQRAYDAMQSAGINEPLIMDTHGWVLSQAGKMKEGIVLLQDVVQRRPFLEARYHLAEAYLAGGYAESAVRQLKDAAAMIAETEKSGKQVSLAMKAKIEKTAAKAEAILKEQQAPGVAK